MTIVKYKARFIKDNEKMGCFREQILSLDSRMPRYTSYPTAPHFKPLENAQSYYASLRNTEKKRDISLYLHIPFCSKLCWYCGCHTKITQRYAPVEDYAHLLMREIDLIADTLNASHSISNIHFGGGSPGLLRACDFERIMQKIRTRLNVSQNAEIAIELDPRGITEGRIAAYAKNGVNRVSLGVQDFDETVLKAINRQQPFYLSYEAVKLLREYGIEHINVDVMYGLPHQTLESQSKTLENILFLNPDRIAFFGYAHVPWMKKHMRLIDESTLPQKDLRFDLFEAGHSFFEGHGYTPVGIDHFARTDDSLVKALKDHTLKRNFQGYVTDQGDHMIGLGVSSIGRANSFFFQNFADMPAYKDAILGNRLPVSKHCPITADDQLRSDIIEQLMCYLSVDLEKVCAAHKCSPTTFESELERLQSYEKMGFIEIRGYTINIHPDAKLMTRAICGVFDAYLKKSQSQAAPKHAQAI